MPEIRISAVKIYVSGGPQEGATLIASANLYVSEGPPASTSRISAAAMYISEGPEEGGPRRKNFMSFSPG